MRRYLLSCCVAALFGSAFLFACSSDSEGDGGGSSSGGSSSSGGGSSSGGESSSSSGGSSGASSGGSSSGGADGGSSSGAVGPACYTPDDAVGWTQTSQAAGSNACTAEVVQNIWDFCVGDDADQAACNELKEGSCFACLTGAGPAGTRVSGFLSITEDGVTGINEVCEANAIGQAAECGSKADNYDSCLVGGCASCFETPNNEACQEAATAGPCAQFVPAVDCLDLLDEDANAELALEKCGDLLADEVSEEDYKKAALYMCGPPVN